MNKIDLTNKKVVSDNSPDLKIVRDYIKSTLLSSELYYEGFDQYGHRIIGFPLYRDGENYDYYVSMPIDYNEYTKFRNSEISLLELVQKYNDLFYLQQIDLYTDKCTTYKIELNDIPKEYLPKEKSFVIPMPKRKIPFVSVNRLEKLNEGVSKEDETIDYYSQKLYRYLGVTFLLGIIAGAVLSLIILGSLP